MKVLVTFLRKMRYRSEWVVNRRKKINTAAGKSVSLSIARVILFAIQILHINRSELWHRINKRRVGKSWSWWRLVCVSWSRTSSRTSWPPKGNAKTWLNWNCRMSRCQPLEWNIRKSKPKTQDLPIDFDDLNWFFTWKSLWNASKTFMNDGSTFYLTLKKCQRPDNLCLFTSSESKILYNSSTIPKYLW